MSDTAIVSSKDIWTPDIYIANQVLDSSVKNVPDDCVVMPDKKCLGGDDGHWTEDRNRRKRHNDHEHGNDGLHCYNVRCIQVMRVLAKFSAHPQAFPYDIQAPYFEFKSKAYPLSLLKEAVK